MKRSIIALALALTLGSQAQAAGQKHRHHDPITMGVPTNDSPKKADTDGIVAYSDTTSADTTGIAADDNYTTHVNMDIDPEAERVFSMLENMFDGGAGVLLGILVALFVLLIVLAPFIALVMIIWLIVRNRNRRYRLAEKAMENGQQIPEELLRQRRPLESDLWRRGIRNVALGLGLVALFYCLGADPLAGIGWLVAFYGGGQAFIGWRDKRNDGGTTGE